MPRSDRVNPRFFYYTLSRFDFSDIAQGTALPYLTVSALSGLSLEIPPLDEQCAIAHILGTLDDKIELNQRVNETLEGIARAIFKSWFVGFDPVRAKAEHRDPGLPQPLADLFPHRFEDSELGEIPAGWATKTIEEICDTVTRGVTPQYQDGSGRYIINQRVNRGFDLDWSAVKELSTTLEVPPDRYAKRWDVLVNCLGEGTLGRTHLYRDVSDVYAVDQHMSICRSAIDGAGAYIYQILSSPEGQNKVESLKTGTTGMTMFNVSKLRTFDFQWPGDQLVAEYFAAVEPIWLQVASNEQQSRTLVALRDTLLPRLISGELRVKYAERIVGRRF